MLETVVLERPKDVGKNLSSQSYISPRNDLSNRFDPYDSSNPEYSEELRGIAKERYQYKFRQKIEQRMPISEPDDYRRAMALNTRRLKGFVGEDGRFDMDAYWGSEIFYERRRLRGEKLLRKICRDINNDVNKEFIDTVKNIKITKYALDKANYISQRVSELAKHIGKGEHYEIGMYMLGEPAEVREGNIITNDIYIGQEQEIKPDHCNITALGKINSYREIKNIGKKIVGWGHSHANIRPYFSGEDDGTLRGENNIGGLIKQWSLQKNLNNNELFLPKKFIESFFAFVVNDRCDEPAYAIVADKPRFYVEDGQIKSASDRIYFKRVPNENNPYYKENWPLPVVINDGRTLDKIIKNELDNQIIDRIIFSDGTRMRDYYKDEKGSLKIDIPSYNVQLPIRVGKKLKERRQKGLEDNIQSLDEIENKLEEKKASYVKIEDTEYISDNRGKGLKIIFGGKEYFIQSSMFDEHSDDYLKRQTFTFTLF